MTRPLSRRALLVGFGVAGVLGTPLIVGVARSRPEVAAVLRRSPLLGLLVGARYNDETWAQGDAAIGPTVVTRLFHPGALPPTYSREGIPPGVKLIVSYKTPDTNVAAYAASVPAGDDVELCYHHEPEADYATGAEFAAEFDAQAAIVHDANPTLPFVFIAGMYQYRKGGLGEDGAFIPTDADRHYADSYLPTAASIRPASTEPRLATYRRLLGDRGKGWDGFTEYGRGVIREGAAADPAVSSARAKVIPVDLAWLRTTPARVWAYWFTTDLASGDQWRFTDRASLAAWRKAATR